MTRTSWRTLGGATAPMLSAAVGAQSLAHQKREWLEQAAQSRHAEVSASRLALDKTRNDQVRAFAQRMGDEHTRDHETLKALATQPLSHLRDHLTARRRLKAAVDGATSKSQR